MPVPGEKYPEKPIHETPPDILPPIRELEGNIRLFRELDKLLENQARKLDKTGHTASEVQSLFDTFKQKTRKIDVSDEQLQNWLVTRKLTNGGGQQELGKTLTKSDAVGLLVSALMSNSIRSEFTLSGVEGVNYLGVGLSKDKKLTIQGDGGHFVGAFLEGGKVTVTDNVGDYLGREMKERIQRVE